MNPVDPLDGFPQVGRSPEGISDMNVPDDQNLVLDDDITTHFGRKIPPADGDLTRFQRAGKSADQSAAGRSDHIIQGGRMGHLDLLALAPVMFGNRPMGPKQDRLLFYRQVGESHELFLATLDAYP